MDYPYSFTLDGEKFPYMETLTVCDEEGSYYYLYDISVVCRGRAGVVSISRWGVSLWYHDGDAVMTNIEPNGLFKGKRQLTATDLKKILNLLEAINLEGMPVSKEDIECFYQRYLREVNDE